MTIKAVSGAGSVVGMPTGEEAQAPGGSAPQLSDPTGTGTSGTDLAGLSESLVGNPIESLLLLQANSFRAQRKNERQRQVAERLEQMRQAAKALEEAQDKASFARWSAALNASASVASVVGGATVENSEMDQATSRTLGAGFGQMGKTTEDIDGAFGLGHLKEQAGLNETQAQNRSDTAAKRSADAGDQVDELRRLEGKMVELIAQLQRGQQENTRVAVTSRA